MMKNII